MHQCLRTRSLESWAKPPLDSPISQLRAASSRAHRAELPVCGHMTIIEKYMQVS